MHACFQLGLSAVQTSNVHEQDKRRFAVTQRIVSCNRELKQNSWGRRRQTIKLITQDKKRTWICEIKLTFMPSCSRVRRQLLHFHVVYKTWSIFQQLSSIFSFMKTRWRQLNVSENGNKHCNQSKYMLKNNTRIVWKYFYCLPTSPSSTVLLKFPIVSWQLHRDTYRIFFILLLFFIFLFFLYLYSSPY